MLLVLLPLAIFHRTRIAAGKGIFFASFIFATALWVRSCFLTFALWGWGAVIIGVLLLGVGVVPMAMLATLFNEMWPQLGGLVFDAVLILAARFIGSWLVEREERHRMTPSDRNAAELKDEFARQAREIMRH